MEFNATEFRENFARKLKKIRLHRGETQEQFSERLGISVSTYKKIEGRINNPSVELLYQVKKISGIPADYLISNEEGDVAMIWSMIQNCSEFDKLELLIKLIKYFGNDECNQVVKRCKGEKDGEKCAYCGR